MFVQALACRRCGTEHGKGAHVACSACGAPLDPRYDWDAIAGAVTRQDVAIRPRTIWRYRELLPLDGLPTVSLHVGWTPLVELPQLADLLGVGRLWVKVEGVSLAPAALLKFWRSGGGPTPQPKPIPWPCTAPITARR